MKGDFRTLASMHELYKYAEIELQGKQLLKPMLLLNILEKKMVKTLRDEHNIEIKNRFF